MFSGLFICFEANRSIGANLFVQKDSSLLFENGSLQLDSQEFNKLFDVNTTNNLDALKVLTSDYMEYLLKLKKEGLDFDFSIIGNIVSIRFHSFDFLEIPYSVKPLDYNYLYSQYKKIDLICNFCLKLNEIINNKF